MISPTFFSYSMQYSHIPCLPLSSNVRMANSLHHCDTTTFTFVKQT